LVDAELCGDSDLKMTNPELQDTLALYGSYLTESGLSQLTVKGYVADLKHLASWLAREGGAVLGAREKDIRAYRADLVTAKAHPATTVNRRLQAIRKFFRYALESGLVDADPSAGIKLLPQAKSGVPRGLEQSEVESLLETVRDGGLRLARRDYAIIQVMLQTGIRVGELTRLRLTDVQLSDNSGVLVVRGRGISSEREIPLNSSVRKAISAYLAERAGSDSDHLFLSAKGRPLSARSVQRLVRSHADGAGLEGVSTFTLRQTYGQQLLRDTGDLSLVARLMGHKRLESAIKYILPGQEDLSEVAERSSLNVF
jgi:site-specific recombinase XerD